jgi:predicted nucleotide-binding protein
MPETFYYVVHSRKDHKRVDPILKGLQAKGVNVWADNMLAPGSNWGPKVYEAIKNAAGFLVIVSEQSLHEPAIKGQLAILSKTRPGGSAVVLLDDIQDVPQDFEELHPVRVAGDDTATAVSKIVEAVEQGGDNRNKIGDEAAMRISEMVTEQKRGAKAPGRGGGGPPDSIFIVHGHDHVLRDEVNAYLNSLGVETVILSQIDVGQDSLFQKFLTFSEDVEFAVVLLTSDDYGASRRQYDAEGVADKALQFRARQNVILELGFFYGYLGWENVFVLFKQAERVFPNFEIPSDLGGILYDQVDGNGTWKEKLLGRLEQAGFKMETA